MMWQGMMYTCWEHSLCKLTQTVWKPSFCFAVCCTNTMQACHMFHWVFSDDGIALVRTDRGPCGTQQAEQSTQLHQQDTVQCL